MLHVAAQGDKPYSIAYFARGKDRVDINSQDEELSTPLHWACIQNSYMSVHYLLAWGANINAQDKAGYTPLHLAVKAASRSQTDYLILKLIMKGASKIIKDNQGRTPLDLISS